MGSRKGRANRPAHPYVHRPRRSGRSPALPYPPRRRAKLYHEVEQCGQQTLTFRKPFRVLFYLRQRISFRVLFYVRQQVELPCPVNPKLKCHPNAQSRNVTYWRRIQSSPRRSLASIEFSVKSKSLQGCVIGTGPRFCFGLAAARAAVG